MKNNNINNIILDFDNNIENKSDDTKNDDVKSDNVNIYSFWSLNGKEEFDFDSWICNICYHLIEYYLKDTDSILSCCSDLCKISSHFAKNVFAYIITDILHINTSPLYYDNNNNQKLSKIKLEQDTELLPWMSISINLSKCFNLLLSKYDCLPIEITKLLLETIEYIGKELNECEDTKHSSKWHVWSDTQKGLHKKLIQKSQKYNKLKNRNSDKKKLIQNTLKLMPSLQQQSFLFPSHVFIANLDLLNVAKSCLKINKYLSSIVFCHLWGMYQFGADISLSKVLSYGLQINIS